MDKCKKLHCPKGFKVRVVHIHRPEDLEFLAMDGHRGDTLPPPRYFTVAELFRTNDDGSFTKVDEAIARCSPRDTPNRKRGYLIAHNRVLVNYFGKQIKHNKEINDGLGQLI